jgi:membrane protease YdiL (CAAX protease family)
MIVVKLFSVGHVTSSSSMLWSTTTCCGWPPAMLAPVVEELFFRGLVLPAIGTNWIGIVGSAIIFSAMHLVNGFELLTAVSTFIVGIVLAVLAVRTKRLGAGIVAHIVYNATLIAMSEFPGM